LQREQSRSWSYFAEIRSNDGRRSLDSRYQPALLSKGVPSQTEMKKKNQNNGKNKK